MTRATLAVGLALLLQGCFGNHYIMGAVIDRAGQPVRRAIISLEPGNVQLVTDQEGRFLIDYLRDTEGERVRLQRRTEYRIEVYKPGYHLAKSTFFYDRGAIEVQAVKLVEDTLEVQGDDATLDPAAYDQRTQSSGATYEGD